MSQAHLENRRLRDEAGEFTVTDSARLYADQVRPDVTSAMQNRYWAWRVWVPEGSAYLLNFADGVIPARGKGLPTPIFSEKIEPGDSRIQLIYQYDTARDDSGRWGVTVVVEDWQASSTRHAECSHFFGSDPWPSLFQERNLSNRWPLELPDEGVSRGRHTVDSDHSLPAGERVVLQRWRVASVPPNPTGKAYDRYVDIPNFDPNAAAPGFVIWLEPTK
ncbi:hypothetical protein [Botrimarina colliarenosi]|nr:hypothetical protein [Botrimarina colliarenosi]